MRKQGASAQQAAWEEQRKKREELESRMSMNKVILHHFTDPSVKMGRAAGDEHSQTSKGHLINREPFQKTRGESPIAALREEERKGHVGLAHYEMRKQGLVPTGNVMVTVAEDLWDVPGGRAVHATVDEDWCSLTRTCPVVASRQRLAAGKHLFRVQWKPRDQPTGFVSADGVLRVGFFADEIEPAEAWDSDDMRGRAFYYRSAGNVYNGPCADPAVAAPAFQPGDTITAVVNVSEGTAAFSKRRAIPRREGPPVLQESPLFLVHGVPATGVRFGVQFEREGPGVVLLDYVDVSAGDFTTRGDGWRRHGIMHVCRAQYADAKECFTKASEQYHQGGDRVLRREAAAMIEEAAFLLANEGVGSGAASPFTKIGVTPGQDVRAAAPERSGLPKII